ncbi:hypothetical protein D477_009178 [Arthrobacter crystallopoietes BAB-32]|uniref:Nicotinamide mononucleotide transporter n=1 Tax=Arthrobacter crystallopoietes BAB-32 TaxID=1246476 RepID=N1V8I8_9MICC|nr:hypothetical protein [Arthrobacter crystallopoietes]EMY34568.1 hypothetical protein D477_009178 [Arthrobacter crystallopoietes BAB-32]
MDWFGDFTGGTGLLIGLTVALSALTIASTALFACRHRWAWLPLGAGVALFLLFGLASGQPELGMGDLLLPAVCTYGAWRWWSGRRTHGGMLPVRRATAEEWGIGAGLLVLFALIKGFSGLELLAVIGPDLLVHAVLSALPLVIYLGLAYGIADAWSIGVGFALLNLASVTAAGAPNLAVLYAAASVAAYLLGLVKWRTALRVQDRPRELAYPAGS